MTDPGYETLRYDVDGRVATITLNRPEVLNAINDPMRRELVAALRRSEADDGVWVVIITGAGRGFCSGADLRERPMERTRPAPQLSPERDAYPPVLREVTKPIIAAINGATRGAGCNIAFGCDFRVASESATFAVNFVERGLMGESAAYYLDRLVGRHRATEVALLGEVFSARDGQRWGFINAVVPPEDLLPAARDLAGRLCARAPLALRLTKKALDRGHFLTPQEYIAMQNAMTAQLRGTSDLGEAMRAFREKRPPQFEGR